MYSKLKLVKIRESNSVDSDRFHKENSTLISSTKTDWTKNQKAFSVKNKS